MKLPNRLTLLVLACCVGFETHSARSPTPAAVPMERNVIETLWYGDLDACERLFRFLFQVRTNPFCPAKEIWLGTLNAGLQRLVMQFRIYEAPGGNKDFEIRELSGLNHLFQQCVTGSPNEYASIDETLSPRFLEAVAQWLKARVK